MININVCKYITDRYYIMSSNGKYIIAINTIYLYQQVYIVGHEIILPPQIFKINFCNNH